MHNPRVSFLSNTIPMLCALMVVAWLSLAVSLATAQQRPVIKVKQVATGYVNPSDGRAMYAAYCASCHGVTGKGDGPAARAFKHVPTNLTLLATNNGGRFPTLLVVHTVKFGPNGSRYEDAQMPVWNGVFRRMHWYSDDSIPEIRTRVLTEYIRTLQVK